jgi:rod shape determining protein RodA
VKSFFSKFLRLDWVMLACMLLLVRMGIRLIQSAGGARASAALQDLWTVHAWTAAIGLVIYMVLALIDYRKLLAWCAGPVFALAGVMLVAVLVFGSVRYGGRRWLWFFQPSELAKIAVILLLAHVFGRQSAAEDGPPRRFGWRGGLCGLAIFGVPAALILAEPDLGTALVLIPTAFVMLLAARVWLKGLVTLLLAGLLAAGLVLGAVYAAERQTLPEERARIYRYMPLKDHQLKRLRVFLFPDRDIHGDGYNLRQARISIGSGSWWGKGLGKGSLKRLGYLPPVVSMNDFIFAVLAEEMGFMGCLSLLLLYFGILLSGLRVAWQCPDDRGRLLAIGVCTLVFAHVYVNVAMSIGLMPITGLPLPLISAGRTFLVVVMAALGLLQSVAVHREAEFRETF